MRKRTKKTAALCLAAFLASAIGAQTAGEGGGADKPRLATFSFRNDTGIDSYASACSSATNALLLTLRQLGIYDVLPPEAGSAKLNEGSLRAWSSAHSADYLMYGSLRGTEQGSVICSLSIFDRAKGKVTISEESEPVGPMDIFDSVDELIASVLKTATGRHIGFGTLAFAPTGAKGGYSISLDGISVGTDAASLGTILIGAHTVTVSQKRMLGETVLAVQSLEIEEGQTQTISFEIPAVLPEEKKKLDELEAEIHSAWDSPEKTEQINADVAQYAQLTSDISYSAALEPSRAKARQLEAEWTIRKNRNEIEAAAWKPSPELLDPSIVIYLTARNYPEPDRLTAATRDNAAFLAVLLELKAGADLQKGAYSEALSALEGILDFSRFLPEEKKSDYAYGAAELKGLLTSSGAKNVPTQLKAIFGGQMKAGQSFYASESKEPANYQMILARVPSPALFGQPLETAQGTQAVSTKGSPSWGTLSFDWLPKHAILYNQKPWAEIGLYTADDGRRISSALPPGVYSLAIEGTYPHLYDIWFKVQVVAGIETRVPPIKDEVLRIYKDQRQATLSSRSSNLAFGWSAMGFGAVFLGTAAYLYNNGYADYKGTSQGDVNPYVFSAVLGSVNIGLGGLLFITAPSKAKIASSIEEIDRQISKVQNSN